MESINSDEANHDSDRPISIHKSVSVSPQIETNQNTKKTFYGIEWASNVERSSKKYY